MSIALTVKEVATLRGCTEQAVRKQITNGAISAKIDENYNYTRWLIPLEELPSDDRRRYMREHGIEPPQPEALVKPTAPKIKRRFDEAGITIPFPQRTCHIQGIDSGIVNSIEK